MNRKPISSRFRPLLAAAAILCLSGLAHAEPPTTGTPAPAPAATTTPPTPAPAPEPGATAPAPARRKEDECTGDDTPAPEATATPSIFDRAAAYMKGKEGIAGELAALRKRAEVAEGALATANATIAAQNTELTDLRAGKARLEAAVSGLETERTDVAAEVAAIGFPAASLPKPEVVEKAGESAEGLLAQFRAEKDPAKKGGLFAAWQAAKAKQG